MPGSQPREARPGCAEVWSAGRGDDTAYRARDEGGGGRRRSPRSCACRGGRNRRASRRSLAGACRRAVAAPRRRPVRPPDPPRTRWPDSYVRGDGGVSSRHRLRQTRPADRAAARELRLRQPLLQLLGRRAAPLRAAPEEPPLRALPGVGQGLDSHESSLRRLGARDAHRRRPPLGEPRCGLPTPRRRHAAALCRQHRARATRYADRLCAVPRSPIRSLDAAPVLRTGRLHGRHADAARWRGEVGETRRGGKADPAASRANARQGSSRLEGQEGRGTGAVHPGQRHGGEFPRHPAETPPRLPV